MTETRHTLRLSGCAPIPLAHYLKALGILRLVSEQVDWQAQGWWDGDEFLLRSTLDEARLVRFFLEEYRPTPIFGPWGAGSGFYSGPSEKTARQAVDRLSTSSGNRFENCRKLIREIRSLLTNLGLREKSDDESVKLKLLMACRAKLSDEILVWLDSTYVLLDGERAFPPLLGTGGNEGSGSYMSGFAQQIADVVLDRNWDHALRPSLFGTNDIGITSGQTPGHFFPGATGGHNGGQGFKGEIAVNPWDYILLMEGTVCFAGACVKRLESHDDGVLAFPFCVHSAAAGYPTANPADEDNFRPEMWLPIWRHPTRFPELQQLLAEGRVSIGTRRARTAIDFARAVATLGVDIGVSEFDRYGFQLRNGDRSNFTIPLGRFEVRHVQDADIIGDLDKLNWLTSFRSFATSSTARLRRALLQLETAIFAMCEECRTDNVENSHLVQQVLIALGEAETAIAVSPQRHDPKHPMKPVPWLSPNWVKAAADGSPEFRLAVALAGIGGRPNSSEARPLRRHLDPIQSHGGQPKWAENADDPALVWGSGGLVRNLIAVLQRRVIEVYKHGKSSDDGVLQFPGGDVYQASLGDVAAFIDGLVDDERIEALVRGLMLVDWQKANRKQLANDLHSKEHTEPVPDAVYAILKLCHLPCKLREPGNPVPLTPQITQRATRSDVTGATRLAARRLRSSGYPPAVDVVHCSNQRGRRTAAALLFPIWQIKDLIELVLRPLAPLAEKERKRTIDQHDNEVMTP